MSENLIKNKVTFSRPNFENKKFVNFSEEVEIEFIDCTVERDIDKETTITIEIPFSELYKNNALYKDVTTIISESNNETSINYVLRVYEENFAHTAIVTKFEVVDLEKKTIKFYAFGIQYFLKKMNLLSLILNAPLNEENLNKVVISGSTRDVLNWIISYAQKSSVTSKNFDLSFNGHSENFTTPVPSENAFFFSVIENLGGSGVFSSDKTNVFELISELEFDRGARIIFDDELVSGGYKVNIYTYTNKVFTINNNSIKNISLSYDTDKIKYIAFSSNNKKNFDAGNKFKSAHAFNTSMRLPNSVLYNAEYVPFEESEKFYSQAALSNKCKQSVQKRYSIEYSYDIELSDKTFYGEFKIGDTARVEIEVLDVKRVIDKKITGYLLRLSEYNKVERMLKIGE